MLPAAWALLLPLCLVGGIAGGYWVGRKHDALLNRIRTLEGKAREPAALPSVTPGAYRAPKPLGDPVSKTTGLVEAKTPERLEWEYEQAIEKEVLGR